MIEPLKIGLAPFALDAEGSSATLDLARQSELAESLGFDSVWLPESHFAERGATPAPLLLLAAVAARTRKIRLGTASYLIPIRHPVQIAEEVAVLDRLSGGRVILGVGRGFRPALFQAYSVPVREKRDRFEQALRMVLEAWRGEPLPGAEGARSFPVPVQKPHPPIWVAAFGPKALAQAGRLGLAYLASPVEPLDVLEENYALHRASCPDPALHAGLAVPVMRTVYVARDPTEARMVRESLERESRALSSSRAARLRRSAAARAEEWALVGDLDEVARAARHDAPDRADLRPRRARSGRGRDRADRPPDLLTPARVVRRSGRRPRSARLHGVAGRVGILGPPRALSRVERLQSARELRGKRPAERPRAGEREDLGVAEVEEAAVELAHGMHDRAPLVAVHRAEQVGDLVGERGDPVLRVGGTGEPNVLAELHRETATTSAEPLDPARIGGRERQHEALVGGAHLARRLEAVVAATAGLPGLDPGIEAHARGALEDPARRLHQRPRALGPQRASVEHAHLHVARRERARASELVPQPERELLVRERERIERRLARIAGVPLHPSLDAGLEDGCAVPVAQDRAEARAAHRRPALEPHESEAQQVELVALADGPRELLEPELEPVVEVVPRARRVAHRAERQAPGQRRARVAANRLGHALAEGQVPGLVLALTEHADPHRLKARSGRDAGQPGP